MNDRAWSVWAAAALPLIIALALVVWRDVGGDGAPPGAARPDVRSSARVGSRETAGGTSAGLAPPVVNTASASTVAISTTSPTWFGFVRPGPENTGPTDADELEEVQGADLEERLVAGAVIEGVKIVGQLTVDVPDVTIRNFVLDGRGTAYGIRSLTSGLLLEDGEIFDVGSAAVYGMGFTARRLNVHDSDGDGFKAQGSSNAAPVLVESCWIHHLGRADDSHADGNQTRSGAAPIVFRGNYFDLPTPSAAPELGGRYRSNAALMLQPGADGALTSFLAEYNWFDGGNYTVYVQGEQTDAVLRHNRFGRRYNYGVLSANIDVVWEGNVWDDTGEAIVR